MASFSVLKVILRMVYSYVSLSSFVFYFTYVDVQHILQDSLPRRVHGWVYNVAYGDAAVSWSVLLDYLPKEDNYVELIVEH